MTIEELKKLSKNNLAKACRNQGVDSSGEKAAMAARLAEAQPEAQLETEPETQGEGGGEGGGGGGGGEEDP